jgi:hypothetical protein
MRRKRYEKACRLVACHAAEKQADFIPFSYRYLLCERIELCQMSTE